MQIKVEQASTINGVIKISGAKNSALAILVLTLLTEEEIRLDNVPMIEDTLNMLSILKTIGSTITYIGNTLILKTSHANSVISNPSITKFRASYYLMGALLARTGKIETQLPGGCDLGKRPIDFHLSAFEKMGAKIIINGSNLVIELVDVRDAQIILPKPSVGATINSILLAVLLDTKTTTIKNVVIEPEIIDVIKALRKMNAQIKIKNQNCIVIKGQAKLVGMHHQVMADRIEAGSWLILASGIKNSKLLLQNVQTKYLTSVIEVLRILGSKIKTTSTTILIESKAISHGDFVAKEYPAFPTDLQQLLAPLLTKGDAPSTIKDNIFPERLSHITELVKMQGDISIENDVILVKPTTLNGALVVAHDLRCAMALVVAGAYAQGETSIENAELLFRGYENLLDKLQSVGVKASIL